MVGKCLGRHRDQHGTGGVADEDAPVGRVILDGRGWTYDSRDGTIVSGQTQGSAWVSR